MRIAIGVSTGTEVVCAALVVEGDDGSRTLEYRTLSADTEANTDLGDLVASAIELTAALAPAPNGVGSHTSERRQPDVIAVTHRTPEQASSIRSAFAHSGRNVLLVPESAASHAYLDDSGSIARYHAVSVIDIGATGTTASVIESASGHVLAHDRTKHFSGDVVNRLVKDLAHGNTTAEKSIRDDLRDDRGMGSSRYRAAKEHLSIHDTADLDGIAAAVGRADFEDSVRPYAVSAAQFVGRTAATADVSPEAVVLIGGGANIPVARAEFASLLNLPMVTPAEPDTILAKGAALLALSSPAGRFPMVGIGRDKHAKSIGRFGGALVGAVIVGGIVLAYGIQTLTPTDDSGFSPAGSAVPTAEPDIAGDPPASGVDSSTHAVISTAPHPSSSVATSTADEQSESVTSTTTTDVTTTAGPSTTPSLHPAPDLPVIPWPAAPDPSTTRPTTPVTTPSPDGSTDVPPTESPEESATPPVTTQPPVESSENAPPVGIPSIDVSGSPQSPPPSPASNPELSPPPTVWTPPPNSGSSEDTETETSPTTQPSSATAEAPAPQG